MVTIGLSPTTYTVSEDVGSVSVAVSLRNGILARDVIVTLQTLDGTAISEFLLKSQHRYGVHTMEPVKSSIFFISKPIGGRDFPNISIDLTLNIFSTTQTVMVHILDDMVPENVEYFRLTLMSNDPAVTLNPATIYINVLDDIDSRLKSPDICISYLCQYTVEIVPFLVSVITIGFNPATYSVRESAGDVSVTLSVLAGTLGRDVTVILTTTKSTAMREYRTTLKKR